MELLILLLLIVLNGIFAMSELAVVSARKSRLRERREAGSKSAAVALKLAEDPNRFLATVQIGITLIGIVAGAFGGSAVADDIARFIRENIPALEVMADELGFTLIVLLTTYLSLVIGELVPKRLALYAPERMASLVARPMYRLSQITAPLVYLLSKSTELVSALLGVRGKGEQSITDFEIVAMMREGIQAGEFEPTEHEMVKGALELDDILVREIITPRTDMVWLEVNDTLEHVQAKITQRPFSAYPVCDGHMDNVIGVVRIKDLLLHLLNKDDFSLRDIMREPFYVPETVPALDVLKQFKTSPANIALVIGEFGGIEGLVTLNDIVEEVLGDVDMEDPQVIRREDGSWLLDGHVPVARLGDWVRGLQIPAEEQHEYQTLAGFIMARLGHIPTAADSFQWQQFVFTVVDMDGKRIDKVEIRELPDET